MIANFEKDKADKATRKEEKLQQKEQDERELSGLRQQYKKLMATLGELEADRKVRGGLFYLNFSYGGDLTQSGWTPQRYERNADKREEEVRSQSLARGIPGYDSIKLTASQINEFTETLQDLIRSTKAEAESVKVRTCALVHVADGVPSFLTMWGFPRNQSAGLRLEAETTQEINNLKSKRESNAAIRADKQRQLVLFCLC
jgi:hypothetical protein